MFSESLPNNKRYLRNFQTKENPAKIFPSSYSKLINLKDPSPVNNPIHIIHLQRSTLAKGASPLMPFYNSTEKGQNKSFQNKPNTPSTNNIRKFNSFRPQILQKRPISVGSNNFRPGFLEPEVVVNHFPNKSVQVVQQQQPLRKRSDEGSDPYRFPLFRTKQIKGFRLSLSPEVTDTEQSFTIVKTPSNLNEMKPYVMPKAPYSAMNRGNRGFGSQIGWGSK